MRIDMGQCGRGGEGGGGVGGAGRCVVEIL